jgi:hypothetical protein
VDACNWEEEMGSEGGKARKESLTPERRKAIAAKASAARWSKVKAKPPEAPPSPPIDLPAPILEPIQPVQAAPEPAPAPKRSARKPVPKEFGKAHSFAEKRLATALKERGEYMQRVAMLNAEIPSLVQIIRALGGTVNPQALAMTPQTFTAPDGQPFAVPTQPLMPEMVGLPPDGIDPNLYRTNAAPVPGLPPPTAPIIPGAAMGGGMDLDYTPRDDEPPQRTKGGDGWV